MQNFNDLTQLQGKLAGNWSINATCEHIDNAICYVTFNKEMQW